MARCEVVEVEQESFGRFLARTREKKGLSQRKLARLTGFSHGYISQLEGGKVKSVTLTTARRLAKGLGVRPEIFLSSADSEPLYLSEHIFEGILKEIKEQYHISGDE